MHWEAKVTLWGAQKLYWIYVTHARQNSDWGQSKFPKSFTQAQILRRVHKVLKLPEIRNWNPTVRMTRMHPASSLCSKLGNKYAKRAGHKLFLTEPSHYLNYFPSEGCTHNIFSGCWFNVHSSYALLEDISYFRQI